MSSSDSFEILTNLCPEIEQGIRNVLSETLAKSKINDDLEEIRRESSNHAHPAAQYALLLFRKYANEVNALGYAEKSKNNNINEQSVGVNIPFKVVEDSEIVLTDVTQMSGYDAMKSHVFQIRALCLLFSIITIIIFAMNHELFSHNSWVTQHNLTYFNNQYVSIIAHYLLLYNLSLFIRTTALS